MKIKIVAVCGSIRTVSANLDILKFIGKILSANADFTIYDGLADLPAFNPDFDAENTNYQNSEVDRWRKLLRAADAVIFCTPEYAHGVPGVLKNALDWVVSSGELVDKPTLVITASPSEFGGEKAMASLLPTLIVMSAKILDNGTMMIPFVKKKLDKDGDISDEKTIRAINLMLDLLLNSASRFRNEH